MTRLESLMQNIRNPTRRKKLLLILSGSLISIGWAVEVFASPAAWFAAAMIAAAVLAGSEIARKAWLGLRNRHTNIELLVTIAAVGGIAIGVYWEAAAVTFLFLLGGWLEARTVNKTRSTLRELINMAPDTAIISENGNQRKIPAREVKKGMLVLVKPGGKIPVDGVVESGTTSVNESAITGESMPAEKKNGSDIYAGTMNQNGSIRVKATKAGSDTTLAKIIKRVEEAQEEKAPTQRFIERFAKWYTPGIIGLSIGSFLFTQDLELALTLLVIGCPGALVISTPISVITGIGNAAKKGILIKGGEYLENAGKVTAVAFDKTGTLTEGRPTVTEVFRLQHALAMAGEIPNATPVEVATFNTASKSISTDIEDIVYWAAIAESVSEHPLAESILRQVPEGQSIPEADHFASHTGRGVEATWNGHHIRVGKPDFLKQSAIHISPQIEKEIVALEEIGRTVVLVARDGELLGGLGIADRVRTDAAAMIDRLRKNGIERIMMLTGDAERTAQAIAGEIGIADVQSGILPEDKYDIIRALQQEKYRVAMIGDGINDAPALATADIGIAMGVAGTDVAIETADIALMSNNLMNIPEALNISKRTIRNIRQNIGLALITVAALLSGVFAGSVNMAGGMLIHELSVLVVILNGMRLRWN